MADTVKISFLGDIMCELSTFRAMKQSAGKEYDFSSFFDDMREKIASSDYVIGNLETPFAGDNMGYTKKLYSFNTPDDLAQAVKEAGIHCVTTANNHCLDREVAGLRRTLDVLDQAGLQHTGTYRSQGESKAPFITDVKGLKIAVISCTAGTNYAVNHVELKQEELCLVDLLHAQKMRFYPQNPQSKSSGLKSMAGRMLSEETRIKMKKSRGEPVNRPRTDDEFDEQRMLPYLEKIRKKMEVAKREADFVVVCPHTGGQFNVEPGARTNYIVDFLCQEGADAVIANHVHVVQKFEIRNGIPIAYCLGNYSMSPNSIYLLHENKPEYSVMLHMYLKDGKTEKITFSILKIMEDRHLRVFPVEVLAQNISDGKALTALKKDVDFIYERFLGRENEYTQILAEYEV